MATIHFPHFVLISHPPGHHDDAANVVADVNRESAAADDALATFNEATTDE